MAPARPLKTAPRKCLGCSIFLLSAKWEVPLESSRKLTASYQLQECSQTCPSRSSTGTSEDSPDFLGLLHSR